MRIKSEAIEHEDLDLDVNLKGRIVRRRNFGKVVFYTLKDDDGLVQVSLERDSFETDEQYQQLKQDLKIGHIVSLDGHTSRSKVGTPTVSLKSADVLSECMRPLPDKTNGLSPHNQYTNRGLHLLTDQEAMERFRTTNAIRRIVRDYLHDQSFEEVDTGILKTTSDSSLSAEFTTEGNWTRKPLYLRKSTELRLKQLMVGGLERIFELGKEFRNESVSSLFLPEFTALELYAAHTDYRDILDLTVGMLGSIEERIGVPDSQPTRFTDVFFYDFIEQESGLDARDAKLEDIKKAISPEVYKEHDDHPAMRAFYAYDLFRTGLKNHPDENIVLHGVPLEISPLAEAFDDEPTLVEEFRYFVRGTSFCGGMTELTDPDEQRRRIRHQAEYLGKGDVEQDDRFFELLEYGLPPCGGLGLSLERVLMMYTGTDNIRDVVYFPL